MLETLVRGFITSRVNFCNSLFFKLPNNSLNELQTVQNACARFLTSTKQRDSKISIGFLLIAVSSLSSYFWPIRSFTQTLIILSLII